MQLQLKSRLKQGAHRGVVLGVDLLIVLVTYVVSNYLLSNFFGIYSLESLIEKLPLVFCSYFALFYFFKTYRGVIRQTSIKDIEIVLISCLGAAILLIAITVGQRSGLFGEEYVDYLRYSYSFVILHALFTSVVMILARLVYKQFYVLYVLDGRNSKRVLIYGAGDSGLITMEVLKEDTKANTQVVGFIDDDNSVCTKTIRGVKVYNSTKLTKEFIEHNRIDDIIISIQNVSARRLNEISTFLDDFDVTVRKIPPVTAWIDGNFSNKAIKTLSIDDLLGRKAINIKNPEIEAELHKKVVLISGAAGSIGSEIARQIAVQDFDKLILVDFAESALYDLQQSIESTNKANIIYVVANIRDKHKMKLLFKTYQPNLVYHAAAYKHVPLMETFPYEAVHTNLAGTKILADLSIKFKVHKFILVSTDKAVNPTNVMGATKRAAEIYVTCLGKQQVTNFIVTRFGNVLGSNGSVVPLFKRQIAQGGPLTVTHQDITRYFMTIPEACQLVIEASVMGKGGEIFVFDMGEPVKVFDLAKKMIKLSGFSYPDEMDIKITGLRPGEKIFEELLADNESTVETHHKKVKIAIVRDQDLDQAKLQLECLCDYVIEHKGGGDAHTIVRQLKGIVPEFKSKNSEYECIDKEMCAN